MKALLINLLASWKASLQTFVDGDVYRESNIDIQMGDIADNFGYLKTTLDAKPDLSDSNTWTGVQTFHPTGASTSAIKIGRELLFVNDAESAVEAAKTGVILREKIMGNANETWSPVADVFVVPQLSGSNKTYKFNATGGNDGRRIRVRRPRSADAFSATLQDANSVTICVFPPSTSGWVDLEFYAGKAPFWYVVGHGGTVNSIAEVV